MAQQPGAVVQPGGPAPAPPAAPTLVLSSAVLLVKKPHTTPQRATLTVGASAANFPRGGVLTRSGPEVELFAAATGGQPLAFTAQNTRVVTAAELNARQAFFAEGAAPSPRKDGTSFTLVLDGDATSTPPSAGSQQVDFTCVRLTLDVGGPRPDPATAPPILPQPPAAPGANPDDKWNGGRLVSAQDAGRHQERAQLLVRPPEPATFDLPLVLRQVAIAAGAITGLGDRLQLFAAETPAGAGEAAQANPRAIPAADLQGGPLERWVQGGRPSGALRDAGYQLGVQGMDFDGDRVAFTVGVGAHIALGSPAVLVRKPHTSPERHSVNISLGAPFGRGATLRRSSGAVRLFSAATGGTELAFTGDRAAIAAADLTRGVQLFAQGEQASAMPNDFVLTLELDPGAGMPPIAGPPTRARITAVEVFLQVGLSRPAAGGDPPAMAQPPGAAPAPGATPADKWFRGRHVGLQNARLPQERARVLLGSVLPPGFAGELELHQVSLRNLAIGAAATRLRLFDQEAPAAGQRAHPNPLRVPAADTRPNGRELWMEGAGVSRAGRDVGLQLGVRGVGRDGDRISATVVQLEITREASVNAAATDTVRVGLWQEAFDPATGNLRNGQAAAANFIDLDPRRFHLRVRDASASGEVTVQWKTRVRDDAGVESDDDDPSGVPFSSNLSLIETAAGSGVFVSRGLLLTSSVTDQAQPTHSGLPAGHPDSGLRRQRDSNHRMRLITVDATHPLDSFVVADYRAGAGLNPVTTRADVFDRTPDERRRMRVHYIDVRSTPGVAGSGPLGFLHEFNATTEIRSIYAACGIFAEIDKVEIDPPASCIGWATRYPGDLLAADPSVENGTFVGTAFVIAPTPGVVSPRTTSLSDLVNAVRALPTFDANDLYLVCVRHIYTPPVPAPPGPGLADDAGGQSFAPAWTTAASGARGFAFLALDTGITEFADPHELTHITTNVDNAAGGHFDLSAAGAAAPGNIDGKNLMHRFVLASGLGVADPKRLWDRVFVNTARTPNLSNPAQITVIRRTANRFLRPY